MSDAEDHELVKTPTIILTLVFIIAIICVMFLTWLFYTKLLPVNTTKVGSLGTAFGISGFVLTTIGFAFTIWQIRKTRASADAASFAVVHLKSKYRGLDIASEIAAGRELIASVKSSTEKTDYSRALVDYDKLRVSLTKLSLPQSGIGEVNSELMKDHIVRILDAASALRSTGPLAPHSLDRMFRSMDELDGVLIGAEIHMRNLYA